MTSSSKMAAVKLSRGVYRLHTKGGWTWGYSLNTGTTDSTKIGSKCDNKFVICYDEQCIESSLRWVFNTLKIHLKKSTFAALFPNLVQVEPSLTTLGYIAGNNWHSHRVARLMFANIAKFPHKKSRWKETKFGIFIEHKLAADGHNYPAMLSCL